LPSALIDDIRRRNAASVFIATAPRTHAPEFIFAAPARAPSGTVVGFVGAEVEVSRLIAAVSRLDPDQGPNSAVFVVDASGRVIAGPAGSVTQPSSAPPALSAVAARLRSQSPVALRVQSAGRDQLIGFAPVPEPGWGVLVEHPTAAVLESTYTLRDLAFLFLLLVVVVAAISGAVLAHYFVAPLRGLGVAVDRMAAGDLGAPLPTSGISELGHLAGEFRRMRDQIAARTMERERAEAEREQALAREREARRQAEAAVRVRDEFLSIAAHELKTPMASLRLWVQFLQRHAEQGSEISPTHLQRALRMVDQQVVRISDLVVQLLEVSRLQLGGFVLKRSVADVSSLVDEAVQLAQVRTTRHELRLTAPAEAWALVDAIRLSQVITNLLDNAIKYSPNGGLIDVALEATGADALRLSVRDRGIGIPPEHRPHVFDLFYQAHAESHRSGMGIGLYVSRQIVELHGGQITLLDPEDGGAGIQAIVYLPSRLDAAAEARAEPHPRPSVRTA
jgi:signal transduction histidine kinase